MHNILSSLNDALESFRTSGDEPTRLLLGRNQVAALKELAHRYTSNAAGEVIGLRQPSDGTDAMAQDRLKRLKDSSVDVTSMRSGRCMTAVAAIRKRTGPKPSS